MSSIPIISFKVDFDFNQIIQMKLRYIYDKTYFGFKNNYILMPYNQLIELDNDTWSNC